jgi:lambda family phage portal protein
LIGSGITARWEEPKVQALWEDWILSLDLDGVLDFYGLQELSARSIYESGECLIRLVSVDADSRMVPLRIQLLEPDHLDHLYNNPRTTSGGSIKYGIEFDSKNRRVAYHIFESHPSEAGSVDGRRVRVPADGMILAYDIRRPGQLRGIPWTHSVLTRINEIDQARNAELIRRKTTAMFGGFVTFPPDEEIGDSNILGETKTTGSGVEISALEPGQFVGLPAGSDIRLSTPSDVSGSYIDWMRDAHREVAKGLRVTFEQLTGDLTQVNFSSIRAGLNEFRRLCAQTRNKIVIQMICRPIARAFYESAISAGLVDDLSYFPGGRVPVSWHPDPWAYVKPSEDVQAEIDQVRAGLKSRSDVVAERGRDARSVDARVFEDNDRTSQAGIRYTTDVYKEDEE